MALGQAALERTVRQMKMKMMTTAPTLPAPVAERLKALLPVPVLVLVLVASHSYPRWRAARMDEPVGAPARRSARVVAV